MSRGERSPGSAPCGARGRVTSTASPRSGALLSRTTPSAGARFEPAPGPARASCARSSRGFARDADARVARGRDGGRRAARLRARLARCAAPPLRRDRRAARSTGSSCARTPRRAASARALAAAALAGSASTACRARRGARRAGQPRRASAFWRCARLRRRDGRPRAPSVDLAPAMSHPAEPDAESARARAQRARSSSRRARGARDALGARHAGSTSRRASSRSPPRRRQKAHRFNATIGIATEKRRADAPALAARGTWPASRPDDAVTYAPPRGRPEPARALAREACCARTRRCAARRFGLPIVTSAITHGLALVGRPLRRRRAT